MNPDFWQGVFLGGLQNKLPYDVHSFSIWLSAIDSWASKDPFIKYMEWSVWCNRNLFLLATEINFRRSHISGMTVNQERLRNWQFKNQTRNHQAYYGSFSFTHLCLKYQSYLHWAFRALLMSSLLTLIKVYKAVQSCTKMPYPLLVMKK